MGNSQNNNQTNDNITNQNNTRSLLTSLYNNNASLIPYEENQINEVLIETRPPKKKNTKVYKNPAILKRDSLKLVC